jgi:hypothetical protein
MGIAGIRRESGHAEDESLKDAIRQVPLKAGNNPSGKCTGIGDHVSNMRVRASDGVDDGFGSDGGR